MDKQTVDKCEQIAILMTIAKMTLTEINTLSIDEKKLLSDWFLEQRKREDEILKQSKR